MHQHGKAKAVRAAAAARDRRQRRHEVVQPAPQLLRQLDLLMSVLAWVFLLCHCLEAVGGRQWRQIVVPEACELVDQSHTAAPLCAARSHGRVSLRRRCEQTLLRP